MSFRITIGTSFTEMFVANDWKPFQSCSLRGTSFPVLRNSHHDYYSIWFNLSAAFFISEKKTGVIKLKPPLFHLVPCHEMLKIILIVHISEIL
jgi:hypothetical protein